MPEFILEDSGVVLGQSFDELSPFVQGYIEAMFFMSECPQVDSEEFKTPEHQEAMEEGAADGVIPCDCGYGDIDPDSLASIISDCTKFQAIARVQLVKAYRKTFPARTIGDGSLPDSYRPAWDYDESAAGRDFWYTRNHHGVGFWDRGLGDIGDKLTKLAHGFGEVNVFYQAEKVFHD